MYENTRKSLLNIFINNFNIVKLTLRVYTQETLISEKIRNVFEIFRQSLQCNSNESLRGNCFTLNQGKKNLELLLLQRISFDSSRFLFGVVKK